MPGDLDLDAVFGRSSPDDAFAAVLTEARMVLAEIADPLEAELWGSDILAALGGAQSTAAQAMVPAAERSGTPEALAILRVLSALGWPDLHTAAAGAAGRLAARGVADPPWAADVGSPTVGECWRYGDDRGLQEAVTMSFEYPAGRHVVSLLLDHSFGGGIKNIWVGEAGDVLARTELMAEEDPSMVFEMISPADALRRARRAIAAGECPAQPDEYSSVASARAILRARVALLAEE
ncbi:MAG TPA: hypothetical protein VNH17_24315 [Streptosporangiaceae bacterium]|jgi:hypothetical protein|nr:hypothetical protein [Streptosporangiaceae bacterium]HXJ28855.1 hypothetical protein [Streptosporangiaceae bacterium]